MAKKIYDIVPPKVKAETAAKILSKEKVKKPRKKPLVNIVKTSAPIPQPMIDSVMPAPRESSKRKLPIKELSIGGVIILCLLGIYLYNALPKANIQIWPSTETLSFQENITADKSIKSIDVDKKIIPAQYIEIEEEDAQEFLATSIASNDGKASGTIRIFNKISPATTFALKTGTHFLSDSGKYFVTLEKVTIPAAKYEKGKLAAGFIDVKAQAEQVGADYNIKASKFSVPKLSGTAYYYTIWAESSDVMAGGYTGQVKKVSKDDIAQAKETLTKKLFDTIENSLKNNLTSDDVLLDNAIVRNIISASTDVKADAIAEKFNESVKVKISALVFKKQDLEKFSKDYIYSKLAQEKTILEKSVTFSYVPKAVNIGEGSVALGLDFSAKVYQDVATNSLMDFVSLKSADQIKETISRLYDNNVSDVKTKLWPFWVSQSPKNKNRIKIELNFE